MPPEPLDPHHTGLIIVDLQNDFLHPDGAYARGGASNSEAIALPERIAPLAQRLKQAGGMVAATRFTLWPDAQGEPMISPHLKMLRPFLVRGDFAPGSHGQANVEVIASHIDVAVDKVAYSGFFNTQLDWVLKKAGITSVIVCGIVTNGGVASTVRDAHMRDYHTLVLEDGCAAFKRATHDTAIADMASIATVTDCASVMAQLE
ncbi:Nicotinamidase-related amidase [Franzmannia pantelleriensis]|uniref:Nicotinamidase-related amidase n=1 Tax=Franzmannia pantelleriensis TaxID=48727 RepID=A0A1G9EHF1_9GAMM|nr:cysteine hydrolase [Halomonas pantelleriensis]SDK75534.1 Nicotinamidase-related amidase [Halomonas pantelleriensis]